MYTIGEFSVITGVSPKTLRHYDDFGLFKPFEIDKSNNYRYYRKEQIDEFMFIKKLKKYGLSLTDIKEVKNLNSKELLNGVLEKQLIFIEKKILNLKNMKLSIEKEIKEENLYSENNKRINYEINEIILNTGKVVFLRKKIKLEEIGRVIGSLYEMVSRFFVKLKSKHMVIIHSRDENEIADVEVFAFADNLNMIGESNKRCFQGGRFLKIVHKGLNGKEDAYANIYDFAKENNYKLIEPAIEKYEMNLGRFKVDIMFKIAN